MTDIRRQKRAASLAADPTTSQNCRSSVLANLSIRIPFYGAREKNKVLALQKMASSIYGL